MSFGWSAGDIAAALTVAYNLIQALDSVDGAAGNYREAVSFLQHLKRTLEPLQSFTAWSAYPEYGADISEQVSFIREPVEQFLVKVLKFEPCLGDKTRGGNHRHVFQKLQWYMFMSKKVFALEKKIGSHMRIIDSLMQRLTMDMVWRTQQTLPDTLRLTFQETIRPDIMATLRENLSPLRSTLLEDGRSQARESSETLVTTSSKDYGELTSAMEHMKLQINSSEIILRNIETSLRGACSKPRQKALLGLDQPCDLERTTGTLNLDSGDLPSAKVARESLQEIYYLVFLYLGCFLKNLFLAISRMVQPPRALMPKLLAQYNISFLDAIGRPPRVLPFEYFRSFKVLQAFIQDDFKSLPGGTWVDRGKYLIVSLANNRALNEQNWNRTIAPGAKVAMSMIVRKRLRSSTTNRERCPEPSCSGTWVRSKTESWETCPVCQKEILNAVLDSAQDIATQDAMRTPLPSSASRPNLGLPSSLPTSLPSSTIRLESDIDEDISVFKRIVQERDAKRLDRDATIKPLPTCPRTDFTGGHNDWLTIPHAPSFDICPSCFNSVIAPTDYRGYFVSAAERAPEVEVLCDFGSCPWFRIAWLLALKEGRQDLQMFKELASITASIPPCFGSRAVGRQWYSVIDPSRGKPIRDFDVCPSCVKSIEVLLPAIKGVFIKKTSGLVDSPKVCDLRFESKRFVPYFDALETMSDGASVHDGETLDTRDFVQLAKRFSTIEECLRDTELTDRRWHTITELPEFTVCEDCFVQVVWPEVEEQKALASLFNKTMQRLPNASCQLSSRRMRRVFRDAVDAGDFELLASTARERASLQTKYRSILRADTILTERETTKLKEEWMKWND
ncbi:uncharacterized protein LY89DRAFT_743474 [Mollisia scopiformis]|uniref:Ubiquitin-like domain-containing protein n=1 Tax=Mollisia scopiformis TaxID=149040 RepID=A0A132B586_MOLSC|nr:uncharacterized protein LY89DRAFT_743474 [Mollisia scopiformis]KUJ06837.1 hypothetical protein LY89DRAFT_743474 [Mollisia scopiformis]